MPAHAAQVVTFRAKAVFSEYAEFQPPAAHVSLAGPLFSVFAHEPSLGQCLTNLLFNAVKFVAPGTVPQIRIYTELQDGKVRIWVEDNGIGIKPEHQERLFRMFERLHRQEQYQGTGIGLAIVRKAIEKMGGSTGVVSDGKNGSRFWLQLAKA